MRRLSWTGRRYLAGTVRGRPSWFDSLLPEVQGTSSWFISWMLEQHEDPTQSMKSTVIECRSDHQRCTIYLAERPAEGLAGKSAKAEELLQRRRETSSTSPYQYACWWGTREQTKNQLVKDKPAGQNLQEQIMIEYLSSEDDEGQLERRSADKSKLEDLLKSGCKRERGRRDI
ncbi:hypothetical protein F511_17593 [Dorcoceras hygrometricum]|uniref:Uncharacterized protein n=1 Tax=Dorcoceras hygrometricum TaxID=472368 RepID=A0A2Z7AHQ2_9LAMI|nr:hypothetical protein F511_17593 [Dorcoceras hygrometricum]